MPSLMGYPLPLSKMQCHPKRNKHHGWKSLKRSITFDFLISSKKVSTAYTQLQTIRIIWPCISIIDFGLRLKLLFYSNKTIVLSLSYKWVDVFCCLGHFQKIIFNTVVYCVHSHQYNFCTIDVHSQHRNNIHLSLIPHWLRINHTHKLLSLISVMCSNLIHLCKYSYPTMFHPHCMYLICSSHNVRVCYHSILPLAFSHYLQMFSNFTLHQVLIFRWEFPAALLPRPFKGQFPLTASRWLSVQVLRVSPFWVNDYHQAILLK